jgi:hypothetical protein
MHYSHIKDLKKDKDKNFIIIKETIEKPEAQENFFSAFAELEILIKGSQLLIDFCFDKMPASVEILEPANFKLESNDFTDFLNDLLTRLHALNTGFQELRGNNEFYIRNMAVLLRNFIVLLLSIRPMKAAEMHPYLGVKQQDISKVLDVLLKEGKIKKEAEVYSLVKK